MEYYVRILSPSDRMPSLTRLPDSVLEFWLRLLALHVEDPVESQALGTKIRDQWLLASRGFFTVCVPEGLKEAVSTEEGALLVRAAIHSLLGAPK